MTRSRAGFSLVEMLVVISIIGLLIGILVPALGAARTSARLSTCRHNVGTLTRGVLMYVGANQNTFPGPTFRYGAGPADSQPVQQVNLFGPQGDVDKWGGTTPEQQRAVNEYVSASEAAIECPMDRGHPAHTPNETFAEAYGTSYWYVTPASGAFDPATLYASDGVWSLSGQRKSKVNRPDRKMVIADSTVIESLFTDPQTMWHDRREDSSVSIGFVDGSARALNRKTGVSPNAMDATSVSQAQVDGWAQNDEYY